MSRWNDRWRLAVVLAVFVSGCFLDSGGYETAGAGAAASTTGEAGAGGSTGGTDGSTGGTVTTGGTATTGTGGDTTMPPAGGGGEGGEGGAGGGVPCEPLGDAPLYQDPETKHCYAFVGKKEAWGDARARCVAWGGDLAGMSTAAEMAMLLASGIVKSFLVDPVGGRCWTGGNDRIQEGAYVWSDGEPWLDAGGPAWGPNEPNGGPEHDCLVVAPDGTLRDRLCKDTYSFLCERAP